MTRRSFADRWRNVRESDGSGDSGTLADALDALRTSETGAGYVYFALDLLATRYALSDAYVVVDLGTMGKQVFRLGGKTAFPSREDMSNVPRGVYFQPDVVSEDDARLFYEACALELTHPRPLQPGVDKLSTRRPIPVREPRVEPTDPVEARDDEWFVSGATGDEWDEYPFTYSPTTRRTITRLLIAIDVANLVLALLAVHGPARFVLGLILGLLIPGWSLVGLLRIRHAGLEIGLSIATSLALIMVCAQIMITLDLWHLVAFEEILCVATLIPLWVQSTPSWMRRLER